MVVLTDTILHAWFPSASRERLSMNPHYAIRDTSAIYSPALVFYKDLIRKNIAYAVEMAGDADAVAAARQDAQDARDRSTRMRRGHHQTQVRDHRRSGNARLRRRDRCAHRLSDGRAKLRPSRPSYPCLSAQSILRHRRSSGRLSALSRVLADESRRSTCCSISMSVSIAPASPPARKRRRCTSRLRVAGSAARRLARLRWPQSSGESSSSASRPCECSWNPSLALRTMLETNGLPVPRIVVGGTPTFPVFAKLDIPGLECSPGTCFLHDQGYGSKYSDMTAFTPAALLLTRVISKPPPTRLTFDLGYKAVASDPPAGKRLHPPRRAGLRGRPAKRGTPRHRDTARRQLSARRRNVRHPDAYLSRPAPCISEPMSSKTAP